MGDHTGSLRMFKASNSSIRTMDDHECGIPRHQMAAITCSTPVVSIHRRVRVCSPSRRMPSLTSWLVLRRKLKIKVRKRNKNERQGMLNKHANRPKHKHEQKLRQKQGQ